MDDVLRIGEPLTYTELMDLALDGLVFRLTDSCWVPVGTRVDAELRARALGRPAVRGLVLSHHSAHWVWWGVGTGPTTREYTTRSRRRARRAGDPWITYERWVQGPDLARVAGIEVTAPARTLYDLVLLAWEDAGDEEQAAARLRRLAAQVSAPERAEFLAYLDDQYRRPHVRALRRLAAAVFGRDPGEGR